MHEGTREVVTKAADAGEGEEDDAGDEPAPRETLCTPGIEIATNALSMSGIDPSDIDLVICATSSPDDLFGDAPYVAHAVGCNSARCAAFDLTAASSGFLFGIVTASEFLGGGGGDEERAGAQGGRAHAVGGLGRQELLHPVWGRGRRHGAHHGGRKKGGGGEGGGVIALLVHAR